MEPRISIITLGVTNRPRSVGFFRDGLGLPLIAENTESISLFRIQGTWLALSLGKALAVDAGVDTEGNGFSGVCGCSAPVGGGVVCGGYDLDRGGFAGPFGAVWRHVAGSWIWSGELGAGVSAPAGDVRGRSVLFDFKRRGGGARRKETPEEDARERSDPGSGCLLVTG